MTREVFEKAQKEGVPTFYYIFKDFGIGRDCKHFVETGTYMGDAVNYAIGLGFEQIFSCELSKERYNHCVEKFKDNDNVHLWLGDSRDCVKEILKKVDQKACFWLDAHANGGGVPTMKELDMIKDHSIKDHTIVIDDIPIYFSRTHSARSGHTTEDLKARILDINPEYKFTYYKSINPDDDYILVAYV